MLDIGFIRSNPDLVKKAIRSKRLGNEDSVDQLLEADQAKRDLTTELQKLQSQANDRARQIGEFMRAGERIKADAIKSETAEAKKRIKELEQQASEAASKVTNLLLDIPNVPDESVPVGTSPDDNKVDFESTLPDAFSFDALPHWDLIKQLNIVDFDRGAKVTGAGFPFYIGKGAKLQRALISFFLDTAVAKGYTELQPPIVVNEDSARGTGQLPDKEDMMYEVTRDGFYLIPTAEVPVTNFLRDEILDTGDLPVKYCAYTPCFRREAGSYGKDVRGLNRLHQFDKVELVQVVDPDSSYDALEEMRTDAEELLEALGLPYRRLLMCTADLGFTQTKKYDLEVWSAAQERWLEVSSISNFESYQARRAKIRHRRGNDKPEFAHTLNGSALALPRIVAALLENGQRADGSIQLPEALVNYTGFDTIS
ncbi:MAG: serine--tRNA ligase [Rhodothermales bacterium]|nr:serine--tRNA ligase [Rhodothermales bacterium]